MIEHFLNYNKGISKIFYIFLYFLIILVSLIYVSEGIIAFSIILVIFYFGLIIPILLNEYYLFDKLKNNVFSLKLFFIFLFFINLYSIIVQFIIFLLCMIYYEGDAMLVFFAISISISIVIIFIYSLIRYLLFSFLIKINCDFSIISYNFINWINNTKLRYVLMRFTLFIFILFIFILFIFIFIISYIFYN